MPHKVFTPGELTTAADFSPTALIPGIEPGGSRAGHPTKPALLIKDCWVDPISIAAMTVDQVNYHKYSLKLSQEPALDPGLILPIAVVGSEVRQADATGERHVGVDAAVHHLFHAQGTIWAPAYVGISLRLTGTVTSTMEIHLDYEVIDVPWMDWFIMWDFLDNIVNNDLEY